MLAVQQSQIPEGAMLQVYARKTGYYTDCFATEMDDTVAFPEYIETFYTTPLFKAERLVLRLFVRIRSSDQEARQLAAGEIDRFAAWRAQERTDTQLLMKAIGRTSSWFMIEKSGDAAAPKTRLFFGTIIEPMQGKAQQVPKLGLRFSAFLGAHRLYSVLLLSAARRRLQRSNG